MEEERFVKLGDKIIYESEVKDMSADEISKLMTQCSAAIQEIAIKKGNYRMKNSEPLNSKKYWHKMNSYKISSIKLQQAITWMGEIRKQKNLSAHGDREHWFFCFYRAAYNVLPRFLFNKLKNQTNEKAKYEIEVEL